MIKSTSNKLHWNYFIALEEDLAGVARFIEFHKDNLETYSIELAHLLFAAASEVDVVAKLLCDRLGSPQPRSSIDEYQSVIVTAVPAFCDETVYVRRYGITTQPWINWKTSTNPDWWRSYNNVKHERSSHFREATLKHVLNAMGALLIVVTYFYLVENGRDLSTLTPADFQDINSDLESKSTFLSLDDGYYLSALHVRK